MLVASIPFAWMTLRVGRAFLGHTLGYRPDQNPWLLDAVPFTSDPAASPGLFVVMLQGLYRRTILQITILLLAVPIWLRLRGRLSSDLLVVAALYWCAFLLWNGGVHQYTAWPLPLLFAVNRRLAFAFATMAGVWLAGAYIDAGQGGWPLVSLFPSVTLSRSHLASVLRIASLAVAVVWLARRSIAIPEVIDGSQVARSP